MVYCIDGIGAAFDRKNTITVSRKFPEVIAFHESILKDISFVAATNKIDRSNWFGILHGTAENQSGTATMYSITVTIHVKMKQIRLRRIFETFNDVSMTKMSKFDFIGQEHDMVSAKKTIHN